MPEIHLDPSRCSHDGLCVSVCPSNSLRMSDQGPISAPPDEDSCLACGHCMAICPNGCLEVGEMRLTECLELPAGWKLEPDQVERLIKGRRSIRHYTAEEVSPALITQLIDWARYAPSGGNSQSLQWTVVHDPAKTRKMADMTIEFFRQISAAAHPMAARFNFPALIAAQEAGHDVILRGAPHLIIGHAPADDYMAAGMAGGAMAYLELGALPLGLGTCWAGFFRMAANQYPPLKKELRIPESHTILGVLMLGHPQYQFVRTPQRFEPKVIWV